MEIAAPTAQHLASAHVHDDVLHVFASRWEDDTWNDVTLFRSADLIHWETSAANPVLRPEGTDEGINASDPEIVEIDGRTYLYFAVGDQLTWMNIKRAVYSGLAHSFFESWCLQPGIPDPGTAAGADSA